MKIPVDHDLFNGGPFFHFPRFFRAVMAKKFMMFMKTVKGKEKDQAISGLMQDPFVKRLSGNSLEAYRNLMAGFCEVGQWIDKGSVRRIADTCYQCELPDFPLDTVQKFIFLFSEKEPARKSEKRLKKRYTNARYLIVQGYGHGGLQGEEPETYAALMRQIAEGKEARLPL